MVDADGLDVIEALVADATAVEGVANVHEGSGYFAERVIRRAVEQGTLVVIGPETHPAHCALATIPSAVASDDVVEKAAEAMWQSESERASDRRRLIPWNEEGGDTQAKWRSLARAAIAAIPPDGGAEERLRSLVETGRDYVKDVADGFAWRLCAESAVQQAKDDLALFDAALSKARGESAQ
jgi:hypothetical protein